MSAAASMVSASLPLPDLYARVRHHVPAIEWPVFANDIEAILRSSANTMPSFWPTTIRRRRSSTRWRTSSATASPWPVKP